jgi:rhodanese-related sulfurtransferase
MRIEKETMLENMEKDHVVVLNVLSKNDFKKLHIKGSENYPLTEDTVEFSKEVVGKYGKGKTFIVYGDRFGLLESYFAAKALEDHGQKVMNYSAGLQEWYRAGLPVEGTEATAKTAGKA